MATVATAKTEAIRRWGTRLDIEPPGIWLYENHCYRNASYAALMHIPEFMDLLSDHTNAPCNQAGPCFKCQLHEMACEYWDSGVEVLDEEDREQLGTDDYGRTQYGNKPNSVFTEFTDWLESFDDELKRIEEASESDEDWDETTEWEKEGIEGMQPIDLDNTAQQDAVEFMHKIFPNLTPNHNDPVSTARLQDLFLTQTISRCTCDECGYEIGLRDGQTKDELGIVTIPALDGANRTPRPLEYFLRRYWFNETLDKIRCDTCFRLKSKTASKTRLSRECIVTAPEFLMLQLNIVGYKATRLVKQNHNVQIPFWLDLNKYKDESYVGPKGDLRYKLCSTIYHGGTANARNGHFQGVYVGPRGVRRINNDQVWEANASNLTAFYPEPSDKEAMDRNGDRARKPIRITNALRTPEKVKVYSNGSTDSNIPYVLVYRKLRSPQTKRTARTKSKSLAPSQSSSPAKVSSPPKASSPATRKASSIASGTSSASSKKRSRSRSVPASAVNSKHPTTAKGVMTLRRTCPRLEEQKSKGQAEATASDDVSDELHADATPPKKQKAATRAGSSKPKRTGAKTGRK